MSASPDADQRPWEPPRLAIVLLVAVALNVAALVLPAPTWDTLGVWLRGVLFGLTIAWGCVGSLAVVRWAEKRGITRP